MFMSRMYAFVQVKGQPTLKGIQTQICVMSRGLGKDQTLPAQDGTLRTPPNILQGHHWLFRQNWYRQQPRSASL